MPAIPTEGRPIFDSHLHIIDPQFALRANRGYLPPSFLATDYRGAVAGLGVVGGAVVAGSFQGFDSGYMEAALAALGSGFVGVIQLAADARDEEIRRLDELGVRAVRFNLRRGVHPELPQIAALARRVHEVAGWHSELYLDAAEIPRYRTLLAGLPRMVIDHLGLSHQGLPHLLKLVDRGALVKASGFGRLDFDPVEALVPIYRSNPGALLFGTDLPSTRAPRPFSWADLQLIADALGDEQALRRVLIENAAALYGRGSPAQANSLRRTLG